jgi:hypothetical protein
MIRVDSGEIRGFGSSICTRHAELVLGVKEEKFVYGADNRHKVC